MLAGTPLQNSCKQMHNTPEYAILLLAECLYRVTPRHTFYDARTTRQIASEVVSSSQKVTGECTHLDIKYHTCSELGTKRNFLFTYLQQLCALLFPLQASVLCQPCRSSAE